MKQPSGGSHFCSAANAASASLRSDAQARALSQARAIELEAAFVLVDELDGDLARFGVAEERRGGERQHDAHLVVENVGAIAAERLVDGLLAGFVADDQAIVGLDQEFLRQRQRVGIAIDHELGIEAGRDLDPDAQIVASGEERHFVDARAGLGVGGLRLPRTERLGVRSSPCWRLAPAARTGDAKLRRRRGEDRGCGGACI